MDHLGYLFAAYSAIFIVIFLYVVFLWRRQAHLEAELKALEAKLAERDRAATRSRPAP
ncbi:MAG: CcmD family protein [Candidatus Binatales bacterium]